MADAPEIATLFDTGRECGCIDESELARAVEELDLDQEEVESIAGRLSDEGIDVRDDCGRRNAPPTAVSPRELASYTTDALQLFLNEAGRHRLLTPAGGGRARQADRARRPRGQGADDQREPAARRLDRPQVPERRAAQPARPDPGGHVRADPRGREVRLAQGLPLLDLRHAVDPAGDRPRARRTRAHDPGARSTSPSASARSPPPSASWPPGSAARPTVEEIAAETELKPADVDEMRELARTVTSLDRPVGDEGDSPLGDLLPGDEPPPDEEVQLGAHAGGGARRRARAAGARAHRDPDALRAQRRPRSGVDPRGRARASRCARRTSGGSSSARSRSSALRREIVALREAA